MNLKVTLMDLIQKELIFDGWALIKKIKNGISIEMDTITWKVYEKGLIIESKSDYKVVLMLKDQSQTKGNIETEFGCLDLQCETSLYRINGNCIEIKYQLIQGNESQLFHFIVANKEDLAWQALIFN
ncbi:hypothetical protein [Floccifex sp.]|uniref:hypothetical protein n=1 Tax=Floccifex sp. TaxID=2815810 RepID=UPI003F07ACB3